MNDIIDVENKKVFFNGKWVRYAVLLNHKRNGKTFNFSRYLVLELGVILYADTLEPVWQDNDRGTNYIYTKLYPDEPLFNTKGKTKRLKFWIARLVYEAFNGKIPIDPITGKTKEVDHNDGDPTNNNLSNLILVNHKQNCELKKQRPSQLFSGKHYRNTQTKNNTHNSIKKPEPPPVIMRNSSVQSAQGFLFALMLFVMVSLFISHNSVKTAEPLSMGIVKTENILRFSQESYAKSVSLPINRRDYFSMSDRANIRQPGKPATELRSREREGVFYENDSRRCQDAI